MKRKRSLPKKPKRFKHGKPAGMSFTTLHQLQTSRPNPFQTPAIEELLHLAQAVGLIPNWVSQTLSEETRDDSKDDDRIVVKVERL